MALPGLLLAVALLADPSPPAAPQSPAGGSASAGPARRSSESRRLAVLPLRALEVSQAQAELLSEVALTEASRFRSIEVIGQSDVAALLGHERQQELLGCKEDSSCMAELGGAMGAAWLLVGSVGRIGQSTRVDLKLIDVKKARVLDRFGETIEGAPDQAIAVVQRGVVSMLTPVAGRPVATGSDGRHRTVHARARAGEEVLVKHHVGWGRGCTNAPVPRIKITRQPASGTVEVRPGDYKAVGAWRPDADLSCLGKVFPGVGVYYRASRAGPASDSFHYTLSVGSLVVLSYEVEARVTIE